MDETIIEKALFDGIKNFSNEQVPGQVNPMNAIKWDDESNFVDIGDGRQFVPSFLSPIYDLANNETYTGATVRREAFQGDKNTPQAMLGKRDVAPWAQELSFALLEMGGGDRNINDIYGPDGKKIVGDLNPSDIEYLATAYTGGVGKFVSDVYKTTNKYIETGNLDPSLMPVINRSVKPFREDKYYMSKFYDIINQVKVAETSEKRREDSFVVDGKKYQPAINDYIYMLTNPKQRIFIQAKGLEETVKTLMETEQLQRANGKTKEADETKGKMIQRMKDAEELLNELNAINSK